MTHVFPKNPKSMSKEMRAKLGRMARQAANMEILAMIRSGQWRIEEVPEDERQPLPVADDASDVAALEAALQISRPRIARLQRLKQALQAGQQGQALALAATLCGLREDDNEASDSASSRKH